MQLLWSFVQSHKGTLAGAMALAAVNQIFSLLDPLIFRVILDRYATRVGEIPVREFVGGVAWLLFLSWVVVLVSRVAKNFQDYFVNVVTQRVGAELYASSVSHSFSLPYARFEDQRSGELLQKLHKARADAQQLIANMVNVLLFSLVGVLFVLTYGFIVHWMVGLAYILILPAIGGASYLISRRIKAAQKEIVAQTAELAGSTTETLRNVELVKSLGLEGQEIRRLNAVNTQILGLELKKVRYLRLFSFIQGTLVNFVRTLLMLMMLWLLARGELSLGAFFSLLFYSFAIFTPLSELSTVFTQFQEAKASMEQLDRILAETPEPVPSDPTPLGPLASLAFQGVTFRYDSAEQSSVEDVSLEVRAGETVAFVGPSGSGKSTLVKLLVGLYAPTEGTMRINGIDQRDLDPAGYRGRIGLVTQETQLFAGSIRDNLLFVRPDATDAECLDVLRRAAALPIVERGGKGLDTKIGEGGIKISGGERQRLAIARALLRRPELLLFDEATSALDSLTERQISETIREVSIDRPGRMTVLVAHRLSTVRHADRIHVLEKGRIIETGRHDDLLTQGGLYAALWREQQAARPAVAI